MVKAADAEIKILETDHLLLNGAAGWASLAGWRRTITQMISEHHADDFGQKAGLGIRDAVCNESK